LLESISILDGIQIIQSYVANIEKNNQNYKIDFFGVPFYSYIFVKKIQDVKSSYF